MNFNLNKKENKKAETFINNHKNLGCHAGFSYKFTPTGIGDAIEIICNNCKKTKNITDYTCW